MTRLTRRTAAAQSIALPSKPLYENPETISGAKDHLPSRTASPEVPPEATNTPVPGPDYAAPPVSPLTPAPAPSPVLAPTGSLPEPSPPASPTPPKPQGVHKRKRNGGARRPKKQAPPAPRTEPVTHPPHCLHTVRDKAWDPQAFRPGDGFVPNWSGLASRQACAECAAEARVEREGAERLREERERRAALAPVLYEKPAPEPWAVYWARVQLQQQQYQQLYGHQRGEGAAAVEGGEDEDEKMEAAYTLLWMASGGAEKRDREGDDAVMQDPDEMEDERDPPARAVKSPAGVYEVLRAVAR